MKRLGPVFERTHGDKFLGSGMRSIGAQHLKLEVAFSRGIKAQPSMGC